MDAEPGPLYLGVDNDPAELGDVLRFLAAELGLPQPPSESSLTSAAEGSSPGAVAWQSGLGEPPRRTPSGGEPSRGGNKRCSNALLRGTGFEFQYPSFREGYRAILAGVGVRHP